MYSHADLKIQKPENPAMHQFAVTNGSQVFAKNQRLPATAVNKSKRLICKIGPSIKNARSCKIFPKSSWD
ncbi:MAG: hypothetical protein FD147_2576 [Chloroflexi bacterium]|nr:MAG: hypothetical protein FD147_2576 [Chloroflexota bacterium]MBA4377005.1 hypothetical protein [Anaerolinea sp.]